MNVLLPRMKHPHVALKCISGVNFRFQARPKVDKSSKKAAINENDKLFSFRTFIMQPG